MIQIAIEDAKRGLGQPVRVRGLECAASRWTKKKIFNQSSLVDEVGKGWPGGGVVLVAAASEKMTTAPTCAHF